jgi:hypothetical protein
MGEFQVVKMGYYPESILDVSEDDVGYHPH